MMEVVNKINTGKELESIICFHKREISVYLPTYLSRSIHSQYSIERRLKTPE
jgi:hypothetical protein